MWCNARTPTITPPKEVPPRSDSDALDTFPCVGSMGGAGSGRSPCCSKVATLACEGCLRGCCSSPAVALVALTYTLRPWEPSGDTW